MAQPSNVADLVFQAVEWQVGSVCYQYLEQETKGEVMLRKSLLVLVLLAVALACGLPATPEEATEATTPFHPTTDTHLEAGEHRFSEFTIPAGVAVTLDGDVLINVEGPVRIDGTVTGDCAGIEIRATGDLTLDGLISNTCAEDVAEGPEVHLIAEGDITLGTTISDDPVSVSDGSIWISDPDSEDEDLTPILLDDPSSGLQPRRITHLAAPVRVQCGTTAVNRPVRAGRGGTITVISRRRNVAVNASLTAQAGASAPAKEQEGTCDNSSGSGKNGGSIRLGTRDCTLRIAAGVTLQAGDGGAGGACFADGGCPAVATAGKGGRGGHVMLGGQTIEFGAGVTLVRGSGGWGGEADARGDAGDAACKDGCDATATGGAGGDAGGIGYLIMEPGAIVGAAPTVDGANGGKGGPAIAFGGDGADCADCPGGKGGKGGNATATGGDGGNGGTGRVSGWAVKPNSHLKGDGGEVLAIAGNGGIGATCCTPPEQGGDGGHGGDVTATGGQIGARGLGGNGSGGPSDGCYSGDGGNGGDGEPSGKGGEPGDATGDPDTAIPGDKGEDGGPCFKIVIVFVGYLEGSHEHFAEQGYSEVIIVILILGNDPVPVPDATVTVRMTRPDGGSETLSTTTDADGLASGRFTIYTYGDYTLTVENVEGENMVYDPTLNQVDSVVVQVGPAAGAMPDSATVIVKGFIEWLNAAFQSRDTDALFESLHPAVTDLYGSGACQAYLESVIENPPHLEVLTVTEQESWVWEIDGRATTIENVYSVSVNLTAQGQTTQTEIHLARREDGSIGWFTDCGTPLP
jgi:hypothetical protein